MMQCLSCGEFEVREERRIRLPSGKLGCRYPWLGVIWLLWAIGVPFCLISFAMWGGFIIDFSLVERILWVGFSIYAVILVGPWAIWIIAYSVGIFAPGLFQRHIMPIVYNIPSKSAPLTEYRRTCQACGYRWTWRPGGSTLWTRLRAQLLPVRARGIPGREASEASRQQLRSHMQRAKMEAYLPFLRELHAHWRSGPDPPTELDDPAVTRFEDYQRALGEPVALEAGHGITGYVRRYHPQPQERRAFVEAYRALGAGDRSRATRMLQDLTRSAPQFADPWIWLSATTDDGAQRLRHLEQALRLEPAHPLAADALALARGEISPEPEQMVHRSEADVTIVRCPKCGGSLHYDPGTATVVCAYCSYQYDHERTSLLDAGAPLVSTLRLQRRSRSVTWQKGRQALHCQGCGAALTLSQRHLAQQCAYCGSTSVLVRDAQRELVQPDGLLPFAITREETTAAIRSALRPGIGQLKLPFGGRDATIEAVEGLYVPFWVFDGTVQKQVLFVAGSRVVNARFDEAYPFDNLPLAAVDVPPPSLLDQLPPFEPQALVAYDPRYLVDWPAFLYTQDVEWVVEDAYDIMLALAARRSGPPAVRGALPPPANRALIAFQVSQTTYQLVLLPAWVARLESEGRRTVALVNGYTGKVALSGAWADGS